MTTGSTPVRYGLPYQGSKNAIARWIVDHLPPADVFVDAFAGGCAITHAALLSGKFKRVIANDITDAPQLFYDAMHGKYRDETRWISRDEFHALKDRDPYVRLCWSFGNNGEDYIYGQHLEAYKKGFHYAAVFEDYTLWAALGIHVPAAVQEQGHALDSQRRRLLLRRWVESNAPAIRAALGDDSPSTASLESLQSLRSLERLQRLERLERLRRHVPRLTIVRGDYAALPLPTGETYTLYCDPPYANTDCGHYGGFDHDRFYQWLLSLNHAAYISEYTMPAGFVEIAARRKTVLSAAGGALYNTERLFVQARHAAPNGGGNATAAHQPLTLFG